MTNTISDTKNQKQGTALLEKEKKIVKNLFQQVTSVIKADRYHLAIFDKRETKLRFWEWNSGLKCAEEATLRDYQPDKWIPDYLLVSKESVLKATKPEFEQWLKDSGRLYENEYPQSWLVAPMIAGGRALGIVILEGFDREKAFDQRDQSILMAMAQRSAEALTKVQLRAGLEAAIEMGKELTSRVQETVDQVLNLTYDHLHSVMDTRDMYVALYDENKGLLDFRLFYLDGVKEDWPAAPMDLKDRKSWTLTKEVFTTKESLNVPDFEQWYEENKYPKPAAKPYPKSWLGVPLLSKDKVLGIISFQNDEIVGAFGQDDVEVLGIMAGQAAVALENVRLYQNLETRNQELKQRNKQLRRVNEVVQELASGINLSEDKILDLIYQTAGGLMDTRDMYIALYDENKGLLEFSLFYLNGIKEDWPAAPMDLADRENWTLTKEVCATKKSLNVPSFEIWYEKNKYPKPAAKPYPKSWLGVPLVSKDKILGIISLQNDEIVGAFGQDDVEVLEIMAGQAVVALENARLFSENVRLAVAEAVAEEEKWAELGKVAGSLAHRIGNKGGLIRLCVQDLRLYFGETDYKDSWVDDQLDMIERSNQYLLSLSDLLFKPQEASKAGVEKSNVLLFLEDAIHQADIPSDFTLETKLDEKTLLVSGNKYLVDVFLELIVNAVDAMMESPKKELVISTIVDNNRAVIEFSDTGPGVKVDDPETVFDLFSKSSDKKLFKKGHRGFGLWWARSFLRKIGGDIRYENRQPCGASFYVELPVVEVSGG